LRFTPLLHLRVLRAEEADEALFVSLWQLRRSLVDLKPGVGDDEDFASFRSFFRGKEARISMIAERSGAIAGFLGWHVRLLRAPGAEVVIIDSDYYFVKPSLRGHVVLSGVILDCFARAAIRFGKARFAIAGHGYPASVLSGARFSDRVRFPKDSDLEPWELEAMHAFADRFCGESFDRQKGIVTMRTIPKEPRKPPRSAKGRELLARFESYDPHWPEGFGLPYLIHVSLGSIVKGTAKSITGKD
jgi:hypothetical protein